MSVLATLTLSALLQQDASFDSYRAHIEAANGALQSGDIRRVQSWLGAAPKQHRGWEWSYLNNQMDRSVATFQASGEGITKLVMSPNGKQVTVGGLNGQVQNYDVASGKLLWTATTDGSQWGVDWSPDGTRIASTGYDFAVHLWHPQIGAEVFAIRDLPYQGFDVRFSPNGEKLVYMGGTGLISWISKGK